MSASKTPLSEVKAVVDEVDIPQVKKPSQKKSKKTAWDEVVVDNVIVVDHVVEVVELKKEKK